VTDVNYNARGQQVQLNDPSNQQTEWVYDGFGDLFQEFRPGSQGPYRTTQYDNLGRLLIQENAAQEVVEFIYDSRGDAVANRWANDPSNSYSLIRTYDILGRVIEEVNFNPGG